MHSLKVALLLILTLTVMRSISWLILWLIEKATRRLTPWNSLVSNLLALGIFTGFLWWNLAPGEPFDYAPFGFGAVVYALCFLIDLKWRPWARLERK